MRGSTALRHLCRTSTVASLAAVLLVIVGLQASADPGQTRFTITWSLCEKSPQTQCGSLKVPIDWSSGRPTSASARRFGLLTRHER